ncbi:hypothetical protein [Paucibacter sp. M5-1]|uniref:hypothetical protein n=1 Tax=Paucibacter sp. M5-1 TaxID=3015998 RepID=UPI0022B93753|nr:hypothetical protein [Paucibacter sp. M5-1]MCZ7882340.1 hypothetical protein [Paucibacter sp. M5-1]
MLPHHPTLALGLAAALFAPLFAPVCWAQDGLLTPQEIQQTLVGKKHRSTIKASGVVTQWEMRADGTMQLFYPGGNDSGTWRLDDKGYCTIWRKMREGKEGCFTVRRQGDQLEILNAEGVVGSTISLGN